MADITVSEDRLREAIAAAINDVRGAGVTFQQYAGPIADGVITELTMTDEQRTLYRAKTVVFYSPVSSNAYIVAKAYIAKCSEQSAKLEMNPELDKPLDLAWLRSHSLRNSNSSGVMLTNAISVCQNSNGKWWMWCSGCSQSQIKSRRQFIALCEGLGVELQTKKGGAE